MKNEPKMITQWLEEHGDPAIERYVEKNLAIVEKVRLALERKGWKSQDFAQAMGKSPSEISKWLTGMHNLTLKSITRMELALGMDLIQVEPISEVKYLYLGQVENESLQEVNEPERTSYEPTIY